MLSEYDAKICTAVFIMVVVCIAVGYIAYIMGYKDAMHMASKMLDEAFEKKFSKAKVVVKKDDRIGRKKARLYANRHKGNQMRERERFFREE